MGQLPYFPPTVAGWEGGAAWLNTNTALARFATANRLLSQKYADAARQGARGRGRRDAQAGLRPRPRRGRAALGGARHQERAPLLRDQARANTSANDRIARQRVLRAFLLGGPDAQVM